MAAGVRVRLGEPMCRDMVCITIANTIDLDVFAVRKAGVLDWSAIPTKDAFRFIARHEIAHVIRLDQLLYFEMDIAGTPLDIKRRIYRLAEIRADRHAWGVLYPGKEMKLLSGADEHLAEVEETAKRFKGILAKAKRKQPVVPLSTDPRDFVPLAHEDGIPWAPEVGADPLCLWETVEEARIVPARELVEA